MKKIIKIILGANLISLPTLFKSKISDVMDSCSDAFTIVHMTDTKALATIPIVTMKDLLGGIEPEIKLSYTPPKNGRLPIDQLIVLLALLVKNNPKKIIEIGTYFGHTTLAMSENSTAAIHTVDLPEDFLDTDDKEEIPKDDFHLISGRITGKEFRGKNKNITQHFGDTAAFNFAKIFDADFIFIDGSHTYEYVKNDTEKCMSVTRKATFLWHDCDFGHPGIVRYLSELRATGLDVKRIADTPLGYLDYTKN